MGNHAAPTLPCGSKVWNFLYRLSKLATFQWLLWFYLPPLWSKTSSVLLKEILMGYRSNETLRKDLKWEMKIQRLNYKINVITILYLSQINPDRFVPGSHIGTFITPSCAPRVYKMFLSLSTCCLSQLVSFRGVLRNHSSRV